MNVTTIILCIVVHWISTYNIVYIINVNEFIMIYPSKLDTVIVFPSYNVFKLCKHFLLGTIMKKKRSNSDGKKI